jgi:hypothetical protein
MSLRRLVMGDQEFFAADRTSGGAIGSLAGRGFAAGPVMLYSCVRVHNATIGDVDTAGRQA